MSEAERRAVELRAVMDANARQSQQPPKGLELLAVGQGEVMSSLARLERTTRHSAWSILPRLTFDPEDLGYELNPRSRKRGVELRTITQPRTLRFNPLLTSFIPWARIGPVVMRLIVIDERSAVVEGPVTGEGDTTAWLATGGEILTRALDVWSASWAESRPALAPGESPPLNERQLDVARGVCLGRTDATIARQLGISQRTVARDVAAILEVTQAGSRAEAVLNMLGRGRQSRT